MGCSSFVRFLFHFFNLFIFENGYFKTRHYASSSSSRLRRFANIPKPVTAAKAPKSTDDLDADSVDLMEFILTLEDEFSIEISDEEIDQLQSVGDVVKIIQGK